MLNTNDIELWRSTPLVVLRQISKVDHTYIGVTLNFSPSFKIKRKVSFSEGKWLTREIPWEILSPDEQVDYFKYYLRNVYLQWCKILLYVFEFTKNGMVHCHAMLVVDDKYEDYNLQRVRNYVDKAAIVRYMVKRGKSSTSNYIHLVDPLIWGNYMVKDFGKNPSSFRGGILRNISSDLLLEAPQEPKPE